MVPSLSLSESSISNLELSSFLLGISSSMCDGDRARSFDRPSRWLLAIFTHELAINSVISFSIPTVTRHDVLGESAEGVS